MDTWLDKVNENMFRLNPETREFYKTKKRTLKENIDFYRDRLRYALNENEDVMKRFFNISSNGCRPMIIEKVTLDRIIKKHGDNGLINISAWRSNLSQEENEANTRSLVNDLRKSGYSFLPGYGGYRNTNTGEESDFEPSFNVFNYNTQGEIQDFEKLKNFGIELTNKYNQDSVLIKAPNEVPIWLNGKGERVSKDETNKVFKNDLNKQYFTSFKSLDDIDNIIKQSYVRHCKDNGTVPDWDKGFKNFKEKHSKDIPVSRRYSYDMKGIWDECCYVNPSPCTLNERQRRTTTGEILVDLEIV